MRADRFSKLLLDASPLMTKIWDSQRRLVDCNQKLLSTFGLKSREEYVLRHRELLPTLQPCGTPSLLMVDEFMRRVMEKGHRRGQLTYRLYDGRILPVERYATRVEYQGQQYIIEYMLDMTDRNHAEDLMRAAVNTSPVPCVIFDENFVPIEVNQASLRMHRLAEKSEYHERFEELCPPLQPCGTPTMEKLHRFLSQAFTGDVPTTVWMHQSWDTGEPLPVEITGERVYTSKGFVLIAYVRDLREEKKMREAAESAQRLAVAEESNRAKSRFLARMSHEIRTPLTSVMGVSEIHMKSLGLPPAVGDAFAQINYSAGMLLNIVNDILDLSKIEAGHLQLTRTKYETATLVKDTVQLHRGYLDNRNVVFKLEVDPMLPQALLGDCLRIEQILNNLVTNAFKYTETGHVKFSLSTEMISGGECTLVASVSDTGAGMTREQIAAIFDEYSRFHDRKDYIRGAGLGMNIVYSLASLMDAHIDIESTPGEGTTVIVRVPQVIADSTEIGYDAAQELMNFQNIKRNISREHQVMPEAMPYGRVLIADDVPANLFVAKGLMSFYDLQIDTCTSGDETIEKVRRGEVYDVIFMDHMMPEKSGVETLQELRGMGYTAPVVVLTANALIGHAEQFLYVGFDGYLSKPIQTRNLDNLLRKFVRDKQPPDVLAHAATGRKARTIRFDSYQTSPELLAKLRADFAAEQRGVMDAVRDAIAHGDMKKAHLLAHTLKGRAGLIYERALVAAAEAAELMLKNGSGVSEGTLVALENELNRVLAGSVVVEPHKINAQLDILEPMLAARSAKSRKHLDELRLVPQAAILVKQVEKLDFAAAAQSLGALRLVMNELGQNNP